MRNILWNSSTIWRGIAVLYAMVFLTAAVDKIFAAQVPSWFLSQFGPTFLAALAGGLPLAFWGIAVAETFLAVAFVISILNPRDPRASNLFRAGLLVAFFLFTALCFGQRLTGKYDAAAFLFLEAVVTAFLLNGMKESRT